MELATLIYNPVFTDNRGTFAPLPLIFGEGKLPILKKKWLQSNISVNPNKWTLRGLHYQSEPYSQTKLVKVITGHIIDFVVDLRMVSSDYNKVFFFEMNEGDEVYVPRYFAHGFITTEENSVVQYLVDNDYSPENEGVKVWTDYPEIEKKVKEIDPFFGKELLIVMDKDLVEK